MNYRVPSSNFTVIPNEIHHLGLSHCEKDVLMFLLQWNNREDRKFSYSFISKGIHKSVKAVSNALKVLKSLNIINVISGWSNNRNSKDTNKIYVNALSTWVPKEAECLRAKEAECLSPTAPECLEVNKDLNKVNKGAIDFKANNNNEQELSNSHSNIVVKKKQRYSDNTLRAAEDALSKYV